ncbi:cytochrome P450 [Pluteus cervinus]|uniref:Cytochrome P450 n=1 Tax=Pluteus cervinus TaxID=181527 RepID=A0ACD3B4Q0_9AGAR|nr:cytochrome P450 [Pluteus cervinus]
MTRNESIYPEPDAFRPERFIDADSSLSGDDRVLAFGFGRRICTGRYLASDSVWLSVAQVIAAFTISDATDVASGKKIDANLMDYTDEGISHPLPFNCNIRPRQGFESLLET